MTPEQIRAAAAQAAAALMAPMQPHPADFLATAEVIETYIANGRNVAFALCMQQEPFQPQPEPAMEPVPEPAVDVIPGPAAVPESAMAPTLVTREAEIIPLVDKGAPSLKQETARRAIEKTRKVRVDSLMRQASVAKSRGHKQRLADQAEEAALTEYPVFVNNETMTLGAYLGSLLGS
jgi:hypothetical protein